MGRRPTPSLKKLAKDMRRGTDDGIRQAAEYLRQALRQLVGHQTGLRGPGSPPGSPPFRRTGTGQANIGIEEVSNGKTRGFRVGGTDENKYMLMHDQGITFKFAGFQQRPWFIGSGGEDAPWRRYIPEMRIILARNRSRPRS